MDNLFYFWVPKNTVGIQGFQTDSKDCLRFADIPSINGRWRLQAEGLVPGGATFESHFG